MTFKQIQFVEDTSDFCLKGKNLVAQSLQIITGILFYDPLQ